MNALWPIWILTVWCFFCAGIVWAAIDLETY